MAIGTRSGPGRGSGILAAMAGTGASPGRMVALLAFACMAPWPAAAEGAIGSAEVHRASVRFESGPGIPGDPDPGAVRLRGALSDIGDLASFDPGTDPLSISLGPSQLVDAPAGGATSVRLRCSGRWLLEAAGADGSRTTVLVDPRTGRLDLRSRGADLSGLRGSGPEAVDLVVRFGTGEWRRTFGMQEVSGRTWRLPRGGGGTGGPPPEGTPVPFEAIDSGYLSGVTPALETVGTDQAAWEAPWAEHPPGTAPPPGRLQKEALIAVFPPER